MEGYKQITKEELNNFIKAYPVKLEYDAYGPEPAMGSYNDFSEGKIWPESIIALVKLYGKQEYYNFQPNEYYIKEDALKKIYGRHQH